MVDLSPVKTRKVANCCNLWCHFQGELSWNLNAIYKYIFLVSGLRKVTLKLWSYWRNGHLLLISEVTNTFSLCQALYHFALLTTRVSVDLRSNGHREWLTVSCQLRSSSAVDLLPSTSPIDEAISISIPFCLLILWSYVLEPSKGILFVPYVYLKQVQNPSKPPLTVATFLSTVVDLNLKLDTSSYGPVTAL